MEMQTYLLTSQKMLTDVCYWIKLNSLRILAKLLKVANIPEKNLLMASIWQ